MGGHTSSRWVCKGCTREAVQVSKRVAEAMEARAEVGQEAAEAVVELRGELVLAFVAPNADRTTAMTASASVEEFLFRSVSRG